MFVHWHYSLDKDRVRKLASKFLDISSPLSCQKDRLLVEKFIRQASRPIYLAARRIYASLTRFYLLQVQTEFPTLMKYEGGWPVRNILAQFLRNRSVRERKTMVWCPFLRVLELHWYNCSRLRNLQKQSPGRRLTKPRPYPTQRWMKMMTLKQMMMRTLSRSDQSKKERYQYHVHLIDVQETCWQELSRLRSLQK